MKQEPIEILVYAGWMDNPVPAEMGRLFASHLRGKDVFFFEYRNDWLQREAALYLDPELQCYGGVQYPREGKQNFGIFLDSSPDRWGRMLMRRREAAEARSQGRKTRTLYETDYLLGVDDGLRMGGLRFKTDPAGDFLNNRRQFAVPPWTSLADLETASLQIEEDHAEDDPQYLHWLSMLVDPGSSLGGARPKAGVADKNGALWMAKFPSKTDIKDVGAWEMVLYKLASLCKICVPEGKIIRFSGPYHTFLSRRFDRNAGRRIHHASALTMLNRTDGDDFREGASYLEMVEFISRHCREPEADLEQLWRRILFNVLVSNTDDHLRNHGFLLLSGGWKLSPAYDLNPNELGTGLTLNITEDDNTLDAGLALQAAPYFRLSGAKANQIYNEMNAVIRLWEKTARSLGIPAYETEMVKPAFEKND